MAGHRARIVLLAVFTLLSVGLAALLLLGLGVPSCGAVAPLFVTGILLTMSPVFLIPFIPWLCRVDVELSGDEIVVRLGSCGRLVIPVSAIASARLVERVEPVWRVAGTALPALYYSGLFDVKGVGRAYIFSERLERLLELRLSDGTVVYLGGNADKLASLLPASGGGKGGGMRAIPAGGSRGLYISAPIVAASLAAGVLLYSLMPERVPIHFTSSWRPDQWGSRAEMLAIHYIIDGIAVALLLVYMWARRRDPLTAILLAPVAAGLALLAIGVTVTATTLCPWAHSPPPPA